MERAQAHSFDARTSPSIPKKYLKSPKIVCMGVFTKSSPLHGALYYIYMLLLLLLQALIFSS
jgi:hypothetical protein